jgi:hypothetical protein
MVRDEWTRDEMLIAFRLYCELPIGKMNSRNPRVKRTAELIGRTPGAVSKRLGNYASCDPEYTKDGRKGLDNGGKKVREIWHEFSGDMEKLVRVTDGITEVAQDYESGELVMGEMTIFPETFPMGWEREQIVMIRNNQSFFRKAVLSSYNDTCCITGIKEKGLLIASHIKPWKDSDPGTERTNPCNGLCLNALHDRAFDRGLMTVGSDDRKVILSGTLRRKVDHDVFENFFGIYEDRRINMPTKFVPGKNFLKYHNESVFEHP